MILVCIRTQRISLDFNHITNVLLVFVAPAEPLAQQVAPRRRKIEMMQRRKQIVLCMHLWDVPLVSSHVGDPFLAYIKMSEQMI